MFSGFPASTPVVGYNTKDIAKNAYVLTAIQFDGVGGATTVNKLITTTDTGTQSWTPEDENVPGWEQQATTLMIPNVKGGYDNYYFASDGYDEDTDETYAGWCDEYGYIKKNIPLAVGLGIWVRGNKTVDTALTQAGEVPGDSSITTDVGAGYTIIGNPFPMEFDIQDVTTTAAATQSWTPDDENVPNWEQNAATIMVPNAKGGYDNYYYASDGYDEDTDATYAGWCDEYGYIKKNVTVPAGTAVWFKVKAAATVTFTK